MPKILITGAAGFIGFHLIRQLLNYTDHHLVGMDSMNNYYDPRLKYDRLRELGGTADPTYSTGEPVSITDRFRFYQLDLADDVGVDQLFQSEKPDIVINLAAQAGVRHSLEAPRSYIRSNVNGFLNILEGCRQTGVQHLIYASSSSVYGLNRKVPFTTADSVDHPASLYAASKRSNELMAHTYSHLFGLPTTGLRFFTVYGPFGRPDMAYYHFTRHILTGEKIRVFNHGKMRRDFTYVDDVVEGMRRLIDLPPPVAGAAENTAPDRAAAPFRLFNIGNHQPVELMTFVRTLEEVLGKKARIHFEDMQPGDVVETFADVEPLFELTGFRPTTDLRTGLQHFAEWYKNYHS